MISFKQKFADLRMHKKLQLMNLAICCAFLLIILIVFFAFVTVRNLSVDVSVRDTRKVIDSSQISRQLAEIYADIDLLSNTFYGKDIYLQFAGSGLISTINNLAANTASPPLKTSLTELTSTLDLFLSQCAVVNSNLHARQAVDLETLEALRDLENLISELLVGLTLAQEDTSFVEQLLMLVVSYRESVLEIGKMHHGKENDHFLTHPQEKPVLITTAIDDLLLRLQTITASSPDIAAYGENISRLVQQYREIVLKFHDAIVELGRQKKVVDESKLLSMTALENIEKEVSESSQLITKNIERIIIISGLAVLLLTFIVVIALVFITAYLTRTNIDNPMKQVLAGIESFGNDDLEARIRLDRKDEWDDIEKGLNSMASNLLKTYRALQDREKELKASELFLNSIIDNIPNMIFVKDADELRFVRLNQAAEELLGYPKESFIGKNDFDFFPEKEAAFFTENDREALRNNKLIDIPHETIQTKDKGERILHTKKIPLLDEDGNPEFLVGISEDITEIKKLEEELLQAQKMEAIGTLAGGIAHDFNNILAAIIGYSQLIELNAAKDSQLQKQIQEILKAGNRAKMLINQILTFSRKTKQTPQPILPHPVIKEALKMLRSSTPTTISIKDNISTDCGPILADPTQIHQIIYNLCTNALQSMKDDKGTLSVSLECKEVYEGDIQDPEFSPGTFAVLTVQDTGQGVDKKHINRIFEPYFTTKEQGKGTGLGLSVIHGIIKECRGFIKVDSEPDKGSSFTVYIPIVAVAENLTEDKDLKEFLPGGHENILVVDDESAIVDVVKEQLANLGYRVSKTTSSKRAVEMFKNNPDLFDLIITDLTMPDCSGIELAEEIFKIKPDIPVILCTGYGEGHSGDTIFATDFCRILSKPVSREDLAINVRAVLDGEEIIFTQS